MTISLLAIVACGAQAAEVGSAGDADFVPRFGLAPSRHPLNQLQDYLNSPAAASQPGWKRALVEIALNRKPRYARVTSYCPSCGGSGTRWGSRTRAGICAADPSYWGPGSVVWIGPPINQTFTVEDTGGAVKGEDHFDVCVGTSHAACSKIGVRRNVEYVVLYRAAPRSRWGRRPANYKPPLPFDAPLFMPRVPEGR